MIDTTSGLTASSVTASLDSPSSICSQLADVRAFILYRLEPKPDGKLDKIPTDAGTGRNCDPHNAAQWMLPADAVMRANMYNAQTLPPGVTGYGVGVVIGEDITLPNGRRLFALDIDRCRNGDTWAPHAGQLLARLPGAGVEISVSGNGLHAFGTYSGERPAHGTRNKTYGMELYSRLRFVAVTGEGAAGNCLHDLTTELHSFTAEFFPPHNDTEYGNTLTDMPVPEWSGPHDDDELIQRALQSRSARAVFGGKASFADLWNANEAALARAFPPQQHGSYDASGADLALANHLAFYTGNHGARIEKLMRRSALARDKWDRRDAWLVSTINRACATQHKWYTDPRLASKADGAAVSPPGAHDTGLTAEDFYAYLPEHKYLFIPTGELWPAQGVNAKLPSVGGDSPSNWLDRNRSVTQMTWAPGEARVLLDRVVANGEWIKRADCACFNLYRPPAQSDAEASEAKVEPWLNHLRRVYPNHVSHLVCWFAHRVQHAGEKINHAIVLGGSPGIGKDSILEPVRHAVGAWNFGDVSPGQLLSRFNGFLKSVILRVSEARDQGDQGGGKLDRYAFYEHTKTLCASPPTTLLVDEKNVRAYPIMNVLGMVITTNHRTDGIYLPADDRRHYVAWSEAVKEDFSEHYWRELWAWYAAGGYASVAAYLARIDISGWDAKAPPLKTEAFWAIVDANKAPEDAELADALDRLGRPVAVTVEQVGKASAGLGAWLSNPANRRKVPHRFESAGYVPVRNDVNQGLWVVRGKRQTIYGRIDLAPRDRFAAASSVQ